MNDFFQKYTDLGFIKKESIGFDQIEKQLIRAKKDLKVAEANLDIDTEASYNYAYLAMLRASRALMFSFGYRPTDGQQHKTAVFFTENVLGSEFAKLVKYFNIMRKKRNRFTYDEPEILVSEEETKNAINTAKEYVAKIMQFIKEKNPQKELFL
ncbi:MAG TPA: HEPN domain-containing protein [Candidatus Paceibacterota bacterium]|nr:HEPN domain-containing protein [Candidatus Paceibacterota bacterium]